ncbi:hypothetical protein DU490_04500 [Halomonas sp. DQ26W]|uniref:hypothetical protein n=1 Tax=Halomonas sp. DQ26W TaxID=2282311 RepID=UPI000DF7B516|nr:hypothetical protein [Halomonas sp. DQ26W]RDB43961.1 hypothetical protein DU490_04500 [Halomonas sp. DQ26W]
MRPLARIILKMLSRPTMVLAMSGVMLLYTLLYLWLTGDIAGGGAGGWHTTFPAWERVFQSRGPFQFEPVGLISLGALVWTFSPINTLMAAGMGLLVGLNVVAGWWLWRSPRQCGLGGSSTGLLALVPAFLAGGACCAPLILIWLGLPIAGALAGVTPLLVPVALLLLVVGLWFSLQRLARESGLS